MRSKGLSIARRRVRWVLVVLVGATPLGLAPPAQAGFPGKPGLIVFSSTFAGDREIFVAAPDGSGRADLTRDPHADITPSWSADGKRIAFASDRGGAMEIYLMNADGSGVAQLTHDSAFADPPRFTADGRYIVYESRKGGNWEIRRIGIDGGGELNLTRNRASDRYPGGLAQRPAGCIFEQSRHDGTHIWVMNIKGGAPKQVTRAQGQPVRPGLGAGRRPARLRLGQRSRPARTSGRCSPTARAPGGSRTLQPTSNSTHPGLPTAARSSTRTARRAHRRHARSPYVARRQPARHLAAANAVSDTFDTGDGKLWQSVPERHRRHQQRGERAAHDDACSGLGSGRSVRQIEAHWGTSAAWPATSTYRPTTGCWSGRPQTASRRRSTPSTPRTPASSRSARARPRASSTRPGSRKRPSLSPRLIWPARCAFSARAAPRSSPTSAVVLGPGRLRADLHDPGFDHPRSEQQHEPLHPPGGQDRLGQLPHQLWHVLLSRRPGGRTTLPTGRRHPRDTAVRRSDHASIIVIRLR